MTENENTDVDANEERMTDENTRISTHIYLTI